MDFNLRLCIVCAAVLLTACGGGSNAVAPLSENDAIVPSPENGGVASSPENNAVVPPSENDGVASSPENDAVVPPPENDAVAPPPENDAVVPPPENDAVAPPPENDGVAPPPENPAIAAIAALYQTPAIRNDPDLRAGGEGVHIPYNGAPVVTDQYNDAADDPAVQVQHLTYANLGLWLMDNTFDDDGDGVNLNNGDDGLTIQYRLLADNRVRDLPAAGRATYAIEGDFVYKGERFYPDSSSHGNAFHADFGRATLKGKISVSPINPATAKDYLGGDGEHFSSGRPIGKDIAFIGIEFKNGVIGADGRFAGVAEIVPFTLGFFDDFDNGDRGEFSGAFFDAADYAPSPANAPREIGGVFTIADKNGEMLNGGFLGAKHGGSDRLPTVPDEPCFLNICGD